MAETQEYRYDVFISYSHADEAWVEGTLLPRLEGAGLRVCIDFRDFLPGKAALFNMQDAARDSRFTLLVLTPDWVKSEWTLFESLLSRTKDPAGLQRCTIPLLLQACDLPDFIAMITWVDFTRGDRLEIAWRQLLTGLGVPPEPVAAPEPERPGWFLPHPYGAQPNFTGRAAERWMLSDWLAEGLTRPESVEGPPHPLLVLRALGGFGKSALAWHWLHHDVDAARWPRAVWWSFYEGDNQFDSFLRKTLAYLLEP
ncbi:MAG: TIR domain-containing protein, partial [Geobacter sp.]